MTRFASLLMCLVIAVTACGDDDDAVGGDGDAPPVVGTTWEWQEFLGGDDSVVTPDDPSRVHAHPRRRRHAGIVADCNQVNGTYTLDDPELTIVLGPSTLVACEEGSLGDQFTTLLSSAASYVMDGDELVISLFADAGTMHFTG